MFSLRTLVNSNKMNYLRPINTWRPIYKFALRADTVTASSCCFTKYTSPSWTGSRGESRRPPVWNAHIKNLHNQRSSVDELTKKTAALAKPPPSILAQLRNNVDPYARLMRIDRPIGKLYIFKFEFDGFKLLFINLCFFLYS